MATKHVYDDNTFTTTTQDLSDGGTVLVERDAYLVVGSGAGFNLHPASWTVQIDGMIQSALTGIAFNSNLGGDPLKNSKLTVGTEGTIQVTDSTAAAVTLGIPVDVTNSGVIDGEGFGISAFVQGPTSSKSFIITNRASGEITGDIAIINNTANPRMTVNNQGTITGFHAIDWEGGATITNTGTINGELRVIDPTTVLPSSITNGGEMTGTIALSNGDDVVRNTGSINATSIAFFDGKNSLVNSGSIFGGVIFGVGDDTVTNSGNIAAFVSLGFGNDTLINSGTILDSVSLGLGDDKFTNTRSILGDLLLGDGNNTATNSGTIEGLVIGGSGNDVFRSTGTVNGQIDLGAGNDVFVGGSHVDRLRDAAGNDSYSLGGGNDVAFATGSGADSFDGGAGIDTFSASIAAEGYRINLGTKTVSLGGETLQAGSAFALGQGGALKGFEVVIGSGHGDIIMGSSLADSIDGGGNADIIAGGSGADKLTGGAGNDVFTYFLTTDSGTTRATRDTIEDFEGAGSVAADTLDLSRIDANTKMADNQDFAWIGNNQQFSHIAGQLRSVTEGANTVIQGDTNGDGKVDFSIAVVGAQSFNESDFIP